MFNHSGSIYDLHREHAHYVLIDTLPYLYNGFKGLTSSLVQTDAPFLGSYCLRLHKIDRFQTLRNNMQQGMQKDATCNIQQCWELLANNVMSVCTSEASE